jgi:hypothetical protein
VHRISTHGVIVDTCGVDEFAVKVPREKRIRQLTEELLQQPCNAVYIVLESLGISKVDLGGV